MKQFLILNVLVLFTALNAHAIFETEAFKRCYADYVQPAIDRVNECNRNQLANGYRCDLQPAVKDDYSGEEYTTIFVLYTYKQTLLNGAPAGPVRLDETITCSGSQAEVNLSNDIIKTSLQPLRKITPVPNTLCPGSVIDYAKGTVSENIPVAGTDFELFYNSEYNRNLPFNNSLEASYAFIDAHAKRLTVLSSAGNIDVQPILVKEFNFKRTAADSSALQEDNNFIKRYQYFLRVEYTTLLDDNPYWNVYGADAEKFITQYKPEVWGLKGWNISNHHYLDRTSKTVFLGNGLAITYKDLRYTKIAPYGDVILAIDRDGGDEFYIFDYEGRHLETRDTIWNKPIHKFTYAADNRILKITNRFGLETILNYDASNQLVSIRAPYGQVTGITIENNLITKITNPLNYFNFMTYGASKELVTFKSLNDEITSFYYDSEGKLTNEVKTSGFAQGVRILVNGALKTMQLYFKNYFPGYKTIELPTVYPEYAQGISYIEKKYDSENRLISKTNSFTASLNEQTFLSDQVINTVMNFDPFWGRDLVGTVSTERKISPLGTGFLEKAKSQMYRNYLNFEDFEKNGGGRDSYRIGDQYAEINYYKAEKRITYVDSLGMRRNIAVNEFGQPLEITEGSLPTQYFEYDTFHRLIKVSSGDTFETYSYDQYGYLSNITNSKNQSTIRINNALGFIREQILPNQDRIVFEYTASGEISKITAPNGQVHYYQMSIGDYVTNYFTPNNKNTIIEYDDDKRLKKLIKPSGGEVVYNYKTNSANIANIETPSGIRQISEIDEQGRIKRLVSEDRISLEVSWAANSIKEQKWYDEDGSLLATLTFGYRNNMLRVNSVSLNGEEFANYGSGDITKGGLINNRIDCSSSPEASVCFSSLDDFTTRYTMQKSEDNNKITKSATVNLNRVGEGGISLARNINLIREFSMSGNVSANSEDIRYDSLGEHKTVVSIVPEYDANNRVISAIKTKTSTLNGVEVESSVVNSSYSLPRFSNDNVKEYAHNQKRTIASHNNDDQLTRLAGSINRNYEYNEDGDLKSMTNCYGKTGYEYDVFGNLKKVSQPNNRVIEYKVDGYDRRVKKLVNGITKEYYIWQDDLRLAAILDANKQVKIKYIYAPDSRVASLMIKDGIMYKIVHEPGLGSVRYVFNMQTKEVVQEIEYDEQGNIMKNTNPEFQPLGYGGGLYDADTKLIRFGARDYDPTIGRWTTKDPIGFSGGDTNLYAYAGNDPMSKVDPEGQRYVITIPSRPPPPLIQPVGPPSDVGPFEPSDICIYYPSKCPPPPFGRPDPPKPKRTHPCLLNPLNCKSPPPRTPTPNQCPKDPEG